jgi:predicted HicB family RNase H-like nuclease
MSTKTTGNELKKAMGLVAPVIHARAKSSAAMRGQQLQEWVAEAIREKLEREDRAKGRTA